MANVEQQLNWLRLEGLDPFVIEKSLPPCICGRPQVIASAGIPFEGKVRFSIKCTEPSRKRCRVAKRLRIYRYAIPKPNTTDEVPGETPVAVVTDRLQGLNPGEAQDMLDLMKADPNLTAQEAWAAVLDVDSHEAFEAAERAAEGAAGIA